MSMKAPASLLAGALLAGWISSPAVAFANAQTTVRPRTDKEATAVASSAHECETHEHASSCTCAHCTTGEKQQR
jgi:hypothetical protein